MHVVRPAGVSPDTRSASWAICTWSLARWRCTMRRGGSLRSSSEATAPASCSSGIWAATPAGLDPGAPRRMGMPCSGRTCARGCTAGPSPGAAGVYAACNRQPAMAGSVTCRRESLRFAEQYLAAFGVPRALVTGNHDLEGEDFDTDEDNLEAWRQVLLHGQHHDSQHRLSPNSHESCRVLPAQAHVHAVTQIIGQQHYFAAELGDTVFVGLSTVRFRSNRFR